MSQQPIHPSPPLDLNNIQGDILSGLPKKTQTYFFFQITNVKNFRSQLVKFAPSIKTVAQVLQDRKAIDDRKKNGDKTLIPMVGINIAFSHKGFKQMNIDDSNLNDSDFQGGQKADAQALGDPGTTTGSTFVPAWEPAFLQDIHGIILVSGDSHPSVDKALAQAKQAFGVGTPNASIRETTSISGDVRPGKESGHEHFGFLDGISNPSVIGFDTNPPPGPLPVAAGAIVMGHDGDPVPNRTPLAVDGSYLAFRLLSQTVPEFDNFLTAHPVPLPGLSAKEGSELLGARLVGRWKSGAPIDLSPFDDDPDLAADPQRNNNFHFSAETSFQKICPFAAHVRKTNPRADLEGLSPPLSLQNRRIMRRGIQFGPEVTPEERAKGQTLHQRGLLFACYQTSITSAFAFIQKSWANNPTFPFGQKSAEVPGLDPIIGQGNRQLTGTDPDNPATVLPMPAFVIPRGGEYFFSPGLKALKETIGAAA